MLNDYDKNSYLSLSSFNKAWTKLTELSPTAAKVKSEIAKSTPIVNGEMSSSPKETAKSKNLNCEWDKGTKRRLVGLEGFM